MRPWGTRCGSAGPVSRMGDSPRRPLRAGRATQRFLSTTPGAPAHRHAREGGRPEMSMRVWISEGRDLLYVLDSISITLKGRVSIPGHARTAPAIRRHETACALCDGHRKPRGAPEPHMAQYQRYRSRRKSYPSFRARFIVFDEGYSDYNWWKRIDEAKALIESRFKHKRH